MASEIHLTPLLLGLGMDELSVVTAAVPRVKKAVQSLDAKGCGEMACQASGMTDPQALNLDEATSRALFDAASPLFTSEGYGVTWASATRWYVA
ncbi:MAG: hypothetical protein ACK56I_07460, partial [bacterium]